MTAVIPARERVNRSDRASRREREDRAVAEGPAFVGCSIKGCAGDLRQSRAWKKAAICHREVKQAGQDAVGSGSENGPDIIGPAVKSGAVKAAAAPLRQSAGIESVQRVEGGQDAQLSIRCQYEYF